MMETSTDSQLPDFEVARFHIDDPTGSYDMLEVRCPRCGTRFWVPLKWRVLRFVAGRDDDPPALPVGRNCPDCCAVSAIPEAWRERYEPTKHRPRRVVYRRRRIK
jgi:hypothetical protein